MSAQHLRRRGYRGRASERGIVLVVALIVLVVMGLVGLAMMRQATTGVSVAGNVALRQNATEAGDLGTEAGLAWVANMSVTNPAYLNVDHPDEGYFSTWGGSVDGDPSKLVYTAGTTAVEATPADATNNRVLYVVHRLCAASGPADGAGQKCSNQAQPDLGSRSGAAGNYPGGTSAALSPFYRISARTEGPKNTLSFIQVIAQ